MSKAFQTIQQFLAELWHRFNSEWLPVIEANLILFWQWLLANPIITLGVSAVLFLWACLVIRKSTHDGWTFTRVLLIIFLFVLGFAALANVLDGLNNFKSPYELRQSTPRPVAAPLKTPTASQPLQAVDQGTRFPRGLSPIVRQFSGI
jgi:hypothetical protein